MARKHIPHAQLAPEMFGKLLELSNLVKKSWVGANLVELVFLRVSQLNRCAHCLDMHVRLLEEMGENPQRLATLAAWRETEFFTERERAALDWAEQLTQLSLPHAEQELDASFYTLSQHFDEREIAELTYAVTVINGWNRLQVGLLAPVAKRGIAPLRRAS